MNLLRPGRGHSRPRPAAAGYTLVEAMLVCAIVAVVTGVAVPISLAGVHRSRGWAGARFVASRLVQARAQAVGRGASVAVRFAGAGDGTTMASFLDGNRNGVLTRDIDEGTDRPLEAAVPLASLFPGVVITDETAPHLFSFSPDGTATGGSVYVRSRDGSRFAVRVLGATARVRIERYVTARETWVEGW